MIQSHSIDNIDDINGLETLEGLTFYQEIYNNDISNSSFVKNLIDSDTEYNDEIISSVIINNNYISDVVINSNYINAGTSDSIDNDVIQYYKSNNKQVLYSQYFHIDINYTKYILNYKLLIFEVILVSILHIFFGTNNIIFNIMSIDGIISSIIFYLETNNNKILSINRLIAIDRYIYYLYILFGYYILNYALLFKYISVIKYITCIMICPNIMCQVYNIYTYKKLRLIIYNKYNNLIQKIICKQLCKIINLIIENIIGLKENITYIDLIPYYDNFNVILINKFIATVIFACIFNHIDKGNVKYLTMIYKNIYMKDKKYKINNDKQYITTIIKDKQWNKLLDVYTLNRIIRILFNDSTKNSLLSIKVTEYINSINFSINRVLFCWTLMSITNLSVGLLGFLLFLSQSNKPLIYLLNIVLFIGISYMTDEKILILVLCEICYHIIKSKLLTDIFQTIYINR